jgi:AcrR family transcriptional regulator
VSRPKPRRSVKSTKSARDGAVIRARSARPKTGAAVAPPRERILNAAFSAFMEKGYAGASTLEIATRAKVSKRELYQVCADKPALLRAAITERARLMRRPLELPAAKDRAALAATLAALGAAVLRGVCDPAVRAVYRLAIAESVQAPEVARTLDRERAAGRAALARTLAQAQADRLIGAGDPATMAVEFFALLWGDLLLQLLLRVATPPKPQILEQRAREATKKFLRLYP